MRVDEAIAFLKRQDPQAILVVEGFDLHDAGVVVAASGAPRKEVAGIVAEDHSDGESLVVFR